MFERKLALTSIMMNDENVTYYMTGFHCCDDEKSRIKMLPQALLGSLHIVTKWGSHGKVDAPCTMHGVMT
jgi:hypothetical protein